MPEPPDRRLVGLDRLIVAFDRLLRGVARVDCGAGLRRPAGSGVGDVADDDRERRYSTGTATGDTLDGRERHYPAGGGMDEVLDDRERRHSAGLMRVNHAGEVAAQALYRGQALAARDAAVRAAMEQAAREESDHLAWCRERLDELGSAPSRLDPLWYAGSLAIGAVAGLAGDRWSLGFVVETERQVVEHLGDHLARLPAGDRRSRALLERMRADEQRHATRAHAAGAAALPPIVRRAMRAASKVMTRSAYRV